MSKLIKAVAPQLTLIALIVGLEVLSRVSLLPSPAQLSQELAELIKTDGLPLIVLASFLENLVGVGTYFPGSIALVTAMALTAGDVHRAFLTYWAVVIPAIAANLTSYVVGSLAKRAVSSQESRSSGALALWYATTYWHPQLAGVTAMASAAEGIPFARYVTFFLPISLAWSITWAIFLYHAGRVFNVPSALAPLFYVYLAGWLLWDIRGYLNSKRRGTPQ
jgi:membrane protein DedA with SNARE-associated domain